MEHLKSTFSLSQRRACSLMGIAVSTFRYRTRSADDGLRQLTELAREKPRVWISAAAVLLSREDIRVNQKRVWRVYKDAGLSVKRRKRKRLGASTVRSRLPRQPMKNGPFASDALATGRAIRVFGVVEERTRLAAPHPLRQRPVAPLASFPGMGRGKKNRDSALSARKADAERESGKLPRQTARRVPQRELVS